MNSAWRLGLVLFALWLCTVLAIDFYASRVLRRQAQEAGFRQLQTLAALLRAEPRALAEAGAEGGWAAALSSGGARITLLRADGQVIADSGGGPDPAEGQSEIREIQRALADGESRAVRRGSAGEFDLLYLARTPAFWGATENPDGPAASGAVLRLALLVPSSDAATSEFRRRLGGVSLVLLLVAGTMSLLASRSFSTRIVQLQEFSKRVAGGDFRPLETTAGGGELDGLARALNQTATHLERTIGVLTDERNRSAAILRSMIEGVAVISAQERVVFSNRAFSQILDLETAAVEGRPLVEVVRQSDLLSVIKKVLAEQHDISGEIVVGTVRPRSFAVTAAPVQAGGPAGAVLVLHDISELRRLERVRQDFVANISHEFRTPLTAIQGFAETLLAGALDDQGNRRHFVEIIREHAERLARLTEDLLRLSSIEAGQLHLEFRPVSVPQLVDSCMETARLKAAPKHLTLSVDVPVDIPAMRGDANRLQEVLQNLLDNAVQYTPAGGSIAVSARRLGDHVAITVADTGIGIPQAEQARIFERFYRVDAARSREAGGTGLGLSIARHIVDAHAGRLWLESSVGEGSQFHFSIPIAA